MSRASKILRAFNETGLLSEASIDKELAKLLKGMKDELKQDLIAQVSRKEANFIRDHAKDPDALYGKTIQEYINRGHITMFLVQQAKKNGTVL